MRVLLLDTNIASYPIYKVLRKRGFNVFVAGNREEDFLVKVAGVSNFIELDYSIPQDVITASKKYNFDFVVPGCNDVSFMSAALVNENSGYRLNIDSVDTTEIINNKSLFKSLSNSIGIPIPKVYSEAEIFEMKVSEFLIKPTNSYSGQGISRINSDSVDNISLEIDKANSLFGKNNIIFEEYISGQLYSYSCFLNSRNEIVKEFLVEENCLIHPYSVDFSFLVDFNVVYFKDELGSLKIKIQSLAQNLNLTCGLIHIQFIYDSKEGIKVLEMTRRCPGDLYSLLIEKSTGFNYAEAYISCFFDQLHRFSTDYCTYIKPIIRQTLKLLPSHLFLSAIINVPENVKNVDFFVHEKSGFSNFNLNPARVGIIFYETNSYSDLETIKSYAINNRFTKLNNFND